MSDSIISRYQIRLEPTGQWTVYDRDTGNKIDVRWIREDALALADSLNKKERTSNLPYDLDKLLALIDSLSPEQRKALNERINNYEKTYPCAEFTFRAEAKWRFKKTGEYRAPRKGEWYLSGSIPAAWQARSDFSAAAEYFILIRAT